MLASMLFCSGDVRVNVFYGVTRAGYHGGAEGGAMVGKLGLLVATLLVVACQPATPPTRNRVDAALPQSVSPSRTLTLGVRYEIGSLAAKVSAGITSAATKRLFNAALSIVDGSGAAQPYLAEALPQV